MTHLARIVAASAALILATDAQAQDLTVAQAEQSQRALQENYRIASRASKRAVAIAKQRERLQSRIAKADLQRLAAQNELAAITPAAPVATPAPATASAPAAQSAPAGSTAAVPVGTPAADPPPTPTPADAKAAETAETAVVAADIAAADKAAKDFGGLTLGGGLSLTVDLGNRDRITEAEVVNGIVRVKNADNTPARLLFESHYLFKPQHTLFGVEADMWGVGPFVAIQPGDNQVINAIGLGLMVAFRREPTKTDSFNLGFGVIMDPNVQLLGDGIVANQPLPIDETAIRYREDSQIGLMAMVSFSF